MAGDDRLHAVTGQNLGRLGAGAVRGVGALGVFDGQGLAGGDVLHVEIAGAAETLVERCGRLRALGGDGDLHLDWQCA